MDMYHKEPWKVERVKAAINRNTAKNIQISIIKNINNNKSQIRKLQYQSPPSRIGLVRHQEDVMAL